VNGEQKVPNAASADRSPLQRRMNVDVSGLGLLKNDEAKENEGG
jgi:hypothetical protein